MKLVKLVKNVEHDFGKKTILLKNFTVLSDHVLGKIMAYLPLPQEVPSDYVEIVRRRSERCRYT